MGRTSSPEVLSPEHDNGDQGVYSIRDRFRFKRNPHPDSLRDNVEDGGDERDRRMDRQWRNRSHHSRFGRKGFSFRKAYFLYAAGVLAILLFVVGSISLQSSISSVFRPGSDRVRFLRQGLKFGGNLKFISTKLDQRFKKQGGLDRLRTESRVAIRPPRLALVSIFLFLFCYSGFNFLKS